MNKKFHGVALEWLVLPETLPSVSGNSATAYDVGLVHVRNSNPVLYKSFRFKWRRIKGGGAFHYPLSF